MQQRQWSIHKLGSAPSVSHVLSCHQGCTKIHWRGSYDLLAQDIHLTLVVGKFPNRLPWQLVRAVCLLARYHWRSRACRHRQHFGQASIWSHQCYLQLNQPNLAKRQRHMRCRPRHRVLPQPREPLLCCIAVRARSPSSNFWRAAPKVPNSIQRGMRP